MNLGNSEEESICIAFCIAVFVFVFQLVGNIYYWDAEGIFERFLYFILGIVQFPSFFLIETGYQLSSKCGLVDMAHYFYSISLFKFLPICILYGFVTFRVLTPKRWPVWKYFVYVAGVLVCVMTTSAKSLVSQNPCLTICTIPLDVVFTVGYFYFIDLNKRNKIIRTLARVVGCAIFAVALAAALAVIICAINRSDRELPPPVPAATGIPVGSVRVRAVDPGFAEDKGMQLAADSASMATICGGNSATADRYEARNDALRSIARERNLASNDVAALVSWLASTNDVLRVERLAALKNDVMNLLRNQTSSPPGFADTLVAMFEGGDHPPAVLDYCIQHLGAMQGGITDDALRRRIRALFVQAAGRKSQPYAGTALYALAEDDFPTPAQEVELRRLALALCAPGANPVARIAAIQLAGQRGYAEALPLLREALAAPRRDAVTDIVCIGSLGLLGTADDIPLLRRFAAMGPRYATAAETAISRIEKRADDGEQR